MIIYYKEQKVNNCFECPHCMAAGHMNEVIVCKAQNKAIGSYGSMHSIIDLEHNVHNTCPFKNFGRNR